MRQGKEWRRHRHALATATAVMAFGSLVACGQDAGAVSENEQTFASTPERSSTGREMYFFKTLGAMAAQSDAIIKAKVSEVGVGQTYGESSMDQFTTRYVRLIPSEVLKGEVPANGEFLYEEEGWAADGTGYVVNGIQWSEVGDEAWYFLRLSDDGTYRLINSSGRYTTLLDNKAPSEGRTLGPSGDDHITDGPWAQLPVEAQQNAQVLREHIIAATPRSNS